MKIILKSFDNFPRNRELSMGRHSFKVICKFLKLTSTKMDEIEKRYMEGKKPMNEKTKNILKSFDNFSVGFFSHEASVDLILKTDRTDRFFSKNGYVFFIDNSINIYTSIHSIHSIHPYNMLYSVFSNKASKFSYSINFLMDMSDRRLERHLSPVYQRFMSNRFISNLSETKKTIESSIKSSHGCFY